MTCPKCDFEEWKMASVVYAEGETNGKRTQLSKMAAPPPKKQRPSKAFSILGFAGVCMSFFIYFLVQKNSDIWNLSRNEQLVDLLFIPSAILWAVGAIWYFSTPKITKKFNEEYRQTLLAYKNVKMCLRCGEFFNDKQDAPLSPSLTDPEENEKSCATAQMDQSPTLNKINDWSKQQKVRNQEQWQQIGKFISTHFKKLLNRKRC